MIEMLREIPGISAGISRKPVDSRNLEAGLGWVGRQTGLSAGRIASLKQVHGNEVLRVPWSGFPQQRTGDALITDRAGYALSIRIADCAPVVVAEEEGRGTGIAHVGWRGAGNGVIRAMVEELAGLLDCEPGRMFASVGPAIGVCCYTVGDEFRSVFTSDLLHERQGKLFFDLPGASAGQLENSGIPPERIDLSQAFCTVCGQGAPSGVSFHSHRASKGGLGRNIAFIRRSGSD